MPEKHEDWRMFQYYASKTGSRLRREQGARLTHQLHPAQIRASCQQSTAASKPLALNDFQRRDA
jgi:hypothetical protein